MGTESEVQLSHFHSLQAVCEFWKLFNVMCNFIDFTFYTLPLSISNLACLTWDICVFVYIDTSNCIHLLLSFSLHNLTEMKPLWEKSVLFILFTIAFLSPRKIPGMK